jgi:hypothetical protein
MNFECTPRSGGALKLRLLLPFLFFIPFQAFSQSSIPANATSSMEGANKGEEWATYGRDNAESPLKQIDASNVSKLHLAWSLPTDSRAGGRLEGTPSFSDGVINGSYFESRRPPERNRRAAEAFNATSGEKFWAESVGSFPGARLDAGWKPVQTLFSQTYPDNKIVQLLR